MERKASIAEERYMIKRPQKAPTKSITDEELELLPYETGIVASPKHDGFRTIIGDHVYTSSLELMGNSYIQEKLSKPEYYGLDGEAVVGLPYSTGPNDDVFNRTTGPVRKEEGYPDFKVYVFDNWNCPIGTPYVKRWLDNPIIEQFKDHKHIVVMEQELMTCSQDIVVYTQDCLDRGYEGAMVRSFLGPYKEGRCTLRELNIFKRKEGGMDDAEAIVIGFLPQLENLNPQTVSKLGTKVRSHHKENMVPKDTLGKFICKSFDGKFNQIFNVGTGRMTHERAKYIWDHQSKFLNKIIVFRYQIIGSSKDAPRQGIFKGFRDIDDLTNY